LAKRIFAARGAGQTSNVGWLPHYKQAASNGMLPMALAPLQYIAIKKGLDSMG